MSRFATAIFALTLSLAFLILGCGGSDGPGNPPADDSYAFSLAWGSFGSGPPAAAGAELPPPLGPEAVLE